LWQDLINPTAWLLLVDSPIRLADPFPAPSP
jgi:hypothetical protein